MLPKRLLTLLLTSLTLTPLTTASSNAALTNSLSELSTIQSHLTLLIESLDSYNGGVWGLMTLASRVNNAQSAIRSARLNLDQLPALGAVEFQDWASTYDELQPVIVKALSSAHGKADHFDKLGIKPIVAALVQSLVDEKDGYKKSIETKMSAENITALAGQNEELDKTVEFVFGALRSV